jgi:hypothetical protein
MQHCDHCLALVKKGKLFSKIDLSRSFTQIGNKLHLGFSSSLACPVLAGYRPDTIILAGDGAVEMVDGGSCWKILTTKMEELGLLGPGKYQKGEDGLSWLAAQHDFFGGNSNSAHLFKPIAELKRKIVQSLQSCKTLPRALYCHQCTRYQTLHDSEKLLILTTNWDLGLFQNFQNVIQLHGRCDYPEEAILPLQNISSLMPDNLEDLERLNSGIVPGPFLQECLNTTKNFIFWGTGLNDYDAALWHFLRGFLAQKPSVKLGVATKADPESLKGAKERILRFFPPLTLSNCFCNMLGP